MLGTIVEAMDKKFKLGPESIFVYFQLNYSRWNYFKGIQGPNLIFLSFASTIVPIITILSKKTWKGNSNSIISCENHSWIQFFEILCYEAYRNQFIWHSPRESRLPSAPENVCHTAGRKICLNYKFCTMCCK